MAGFKRKARDSGTPEIALFPEMLQRLTQLVPRPVDVRLYRPERQVEGRCDFLVLAPFDVPEHDAGAVLGAERCDRLLDGAAELPGFHLLQRRFLRVADVE